jgi:hypothetical protein
MQLAAQVAAVRSSFFLFWLSDVHYLGSVPGALRYRRKTKV